MDVIRGDWMRLTILPARLIPALGVQLSGSNGKCDYTERAYEETQILDSNYCVRAGDNHLRCYFCCNRRFWICHL